jgi:sodium/potassium-transporting ATPase subunit alpha
MSEQPNNSDSTSNANGGVAKPPSKSLSKRLAGTFRKNKGSTDVSQAEKLRQEIGFTEHTWPVDKCYDYYGSSAEIGLTGAQMLQNREKYGWNRLTPPEVTPWWIKYLSQFADIFMLLLLFGGVISFVAYGIDTSDPTNLYLGVVLVLVVWISGTFGYYTESKANSVMEGFKKMVPKKSKVLRDGHWAILNAEELVPGDVVELNDGDQVPADIRVVFAQDMKVDNSSLTGESEAVERYPDLQLDSDGKPVTVPLEAQNLCFYTTIVTSGSGKGIVIGTGDKTVMGQIAGLAASAGTNEKTQFQKEVDTFIYYISILAITIGITFILIGVFVAKASIIDMIVFAIGIIVGTVPEGLLVTLTVALALSAKSMYAKNVLVKGMPSVENLGSTTVIASDKTGTLTQNRMTVQHAWYNGTLVTIPAARNRPQLKAAMRPGVIKGPVYNPEDPTFKTLQMVASLCNNSRFIVVDPKDEKAAPINLKEEMENPEFNLLGLDCTGDASESGLIKGVQLLRDVADFNNANPKIHEIKFNSTNKWQLSIHKPEDPNAKHPILVLKGAPERVLYKCKKIMVDEGEEIVMDEEWQKKYNEAYESLGAMGERVLGFAYREMKELSLDYQFTNKPEPNFTFDDLTFVGLMSLIDPPREGVPEAVAKCKRARVKVYMVTGDHPITAQAIAKQVGIIDEDKWDAGKAVVIKGDDIRSWMEIEDPVERQAKWDWALDHEQIVFARVSPAHKLLIVENCQRRGENVAVTGDGVNDAPALKRANTGVAMGIAGKDVTKEASDMILMDDNFASIVNGIEEGRVIFDNLKKSIAYTLASKFPEQIPFLLYVAASFPLAISTILILTIDLGCDMVPAISLAYEPKEADIMMRPPRNPAVDRLVSRKLISFSYFQIGLLQTASGFLGFMTVMNDYGYTWSNLVGNGIQWERTQLACNIDLSGDAPTPSNCGFTCNSPETSFNGQDTLYKIQENELGTKNAFCYDGCPIPFIGTGDPFVEFTEYGFRGYTPTDALPNSDLSWDTSTAEAAVCARTCGWYDNLSEEVKAYLLGAHAEFVELKNADALDPSNPFVLPEAPQLTYANILTPGDVELFDAYCAGSVTDNDLFGFPGRKLAFKDSVAKTGAFYWWNAEPQYWPNVDYQKAVLATAQTVYFASVVVARVGDLLICKTRTETIFKQGMRNRVLNFGAVFMLVIVALISYVPGFKDVWGTRPMNILYWFVGVPYFIVIVVYDETRKLMIRNKPRGWVYRNTYY